MPLETNPSYISDLDSSWPTGQDDRIQGDDHIRNIKRVLKLSLPNISGPVTANHTELSLLAGRTIGAVAVSGVWLLFHMPTPPMGWTRFAGYHDRALRVVGDGNLVNGGSMPFSSCLTSGRTTELHALTVSQMPSHSHGVNDPGHSHSSPQYAVTGTAQSGCCENALTPSGSSVGGSGSNISIATNGGGQGHSHAVQLDILYVDVILASKD